jgi:hypothetical protein
MCLPPLQICGARSIFGEGLGRGAGKGDERRALRRAYGVRMLCSSEVLFIPKQLLDDFFAATSRKRQELKKDLFSKLSVLGEGRESWMAHTVCTLPNLTCIWILLSKAANKLRLPSCRRRD